MKQYLNYKESPKTGLSIYYYIDIFFRKIEFSFWIIICLIFIGLSKNNKKLNDDISLFLVDVSLPISTAISSPFTAVGNITEYFGELLSAKRENKILRAENEKLKSIYVKALNVAQENEELQNLLKFINVHSTKYKAVRLVTKPSQSYGSNIIINAGKNQGIQENSIVTGKRSVIGRVVHVMDNKSRVLTIHDENSKIPVITANSREKGILVGHNNNIMTIEYLDKDHKIVKGDLVYTSGDGEHLSPGLLIGTVINVRGSKVKVKAMQNPDNVNLAVISSIN